MHNRTATHRQSLWASDFRTRLLFHVLYPRSSAVWGEVLVSCHSRVVVVGFLELQGPWNQRTPQPLKRATGGCWFHAAEKAGPNR